MQARRASIQRAGMRISRTRSPSSTKMKQFAPL
jgi:hypothetical protein